MKTNFFIIFVTVVLSLYSLLNLYVFIRGLQAISPSSNLKLFYKITFIALASCYILARIAESISVSYLSTALMWIGSFWLAAMAYFVLICVLFDLVRLSNWIFPFYPSMIKDNYIQTKFYIFLGVIATVSTVLIYGFINANSPKLTSLTLSVNKKAGNLKSLSILAVSDIHLGALIGDSDVEKIVKIANEIKPDLILIVGDLLDENPDPVIKYNKGANLNLLKAKYGVYGVLGNHEYFKSIKGSEDFFKSHNIALLEDTVVEIADAFYLAGRHDKDKVRFNGEARKELNQIVNNIDTSKPLLLMDHQPFYLDSAVKNGVDLQVSGHTHNGQMFPFNGITQLVFEKSVGYLKKGNTHFYVSYGFGTWGPQVRIGTISEVVHITLNFQQ